MAHPLLQACLLYGIIDLAYIPEDRIIDTTHKLLEGGIKILQLRAKNVDKDIILKYAMELCPICQNNNCLFIINDYPDIALTCGADGVHIGQDDGAIADIRNTVGSSMIIGRSTHSYEQAIQAYQEKADYIGFGPLFATQTKPGRQPIGLEDIKNVHRDLPSDFPIYCIGGINEGTMKEVQSAGAKRVVIVSWLLQQPNISEATQQVRMELLED